MDFGDLIILLLFLAPVLSRLFGKKPPRPQPGPSPEGLTERELEDPLADALRQIRKALGDETVDRKPEPEPVATSEPRSFHDEERPWSGFDTPETEFRPVGEFEHERHGFGAENPLSEEVFEQRPAFVTTGGTEPIGTHTPDPVDLTTPLEVARRESTAGPTLASILRDPKRAREAFILHEVLDGPRNALLRDRRR